MKIKHIKEKELLSHYNENPNYYSPIDNNNMELIFERILEKPLTEDMSVLDIGCGDGRLSKYVPGKYVGVDYSEIRIEKAKEKYEGMFILKDINSYTPDENFDVICMFEVLEHLVEPKKLIERLRPFTGTIMGTVPIDMPYEAHLQVFKTKNDVEKELNVEVMFTGKKHFFIKT